MRGYKPECKPRVEGGCTYTLILSWGLFHYLSIYYIYINHDAGLYLAGLITNLFDI